MTLDLTEPLPAIGPPTVGVVMPLGFMLGDGTSCTPFTGTAPIVEGIRMDYGCGGQQTGPLLVGGALNTSTANWTFLTTNADLSQALTTTSMATAYL